MKQSLTQFDDEDWNEMKLNIHLSYEISDKIPKTKFIFNDTNCNDTNLLRSYLKQLYNKYIVTYSKLEINVSDSDKRECKNTIDNFGNTIENGKNNISAFSKENMKCEIEKVIPAYEACAKDVLKLTRQCFTRFKGSPSFEKIKLALED